MSLALPFGFDGMTGGLHNVVPDVAVALFEAAQRGETAAAERCQQKLDRVLTVFEADGGWRGVQVALEYMGIAARVRLSPADLPVAPEVRERILVVVLAAEGVLRPPVRGTATLISGVNVDVQALSLEGPGSAADSARAGACAVIIEGAAVESAKPLDLRSLDRICEAA